jgi:hypothetical protein
MKNEIQDACNKCYDHAGGQYQEDIDFGFAHNNADEKIKYIVILRIYIR